MKSLFLFIAIFLGSLLAFQSIAQTQLVSGDIATNAKYLDVDKFGIFKEGYCIVKKGTQTALIDSAGNFKIPFNNAYMPSSDANFAETDDINENDAGFSNGMCAVRDAKTKLVGYINKDFKLVIPCQYASGGAFRYGFAAVNATHGLTRPYPQEEIPIAANTKPFSGSIDKNGQRFVSVINNGLPLVSFSEKSLYGYKDIFGKVIISPKFDDCREFSEGLAAVMKRDEFGKPKWGYINILGNKVIDLVYSKTPGSFHNGLALVIPADQSEFNYGYIDSKNELKIKIDKKYGSNANLLEYAPFYDFKNGFALVNSQFIDTAGIIHYFPRISGVFYNRLTSVKVEGTNNQYFFFRSDDGFTKEGLAVIDMANGLSGVFNTKNEMVQQPVFNKIDLPQDGIKLFRAEYFDYLKGEKVNVKYGFVNEKGLFVILKAKEQKW